ncbi:MAG: hypothetical protein ACRDLS_01415 [Solirubrobacteraceae bacterium]
MLRWEAAFVLGRSEHEVGRDVRSGALETVGVGRNRRITAAALREACEGEPLRLALADAVLYGRLVAPRAARADRTPSSYFDLPDLPRRRVWEHRV